MHKKCTCAYCGCPVEEGRKVCKKCESTDLDYIFSRERKSKRVEKRKRDVHKRREKEKIDDFY